jgi:exodeoxyribonuclease III
MHGYLSTLGWIDAWRACNLGQNDFSYVHRFAAGSSNWRIDHAFVSPALASSVARCRYSHAEREQKLSDHSMLIIEFE